jgi:hypothetical protein
MTDFSLRHVRLAYRKLKKTVYYDNTDLQLRLRLAEFEIDPDFEQNLRQITRLLNTDRPFGQPVFKRWLRAIGYRIVPKEFLFGMSQSYGEGQFISNVTSAASCDVQSVNYFFCRACPAARDIVSLVDERRLSVRCQPRE